MRWKLVAPPAAEAVTLETAKRHLKVDTAEDDPLITDLVAAARRAVETATGAMLITQTWVASLDRWPAGPIALTRRPVQAVTGITVKDADGVPVALDAASYDVDLSGDPARVFWRGGTAPPRSADSVAGIAITVVLGYGPQGDDVPEPLRQAVLMLTGHWYEHRSAAVSEAPGSVPQGVAALIAPYRGVRL